MNKALFLDRDGTIIVDKGYLENPEDIELAVGAGEALSRAVDAGYMLVIVTNQSGIGRGYFPESAVIAQHRFLETKLNRFGVSLAGIRYCPHAPEDLCQCRKPLPAMLIDAARELDIDCSQSFMIGDKPSDVAAGKAAGCRTIGIGSETSFHADFQAVDLAEAVNLIFRHG